MNVTNNIPAKKNNKQNSFKGQYRPVINFFKNDKVNSGFQKLEDPAMQLLFVNCTSLIAPGIIVDSYRNKYAGAETAFYQLFNSAVNYLGAGLIALGVAGGLKYVLNPSKVNTMGWVSNKSVDFLKDQYKHQFSTYNNAEGSKQFIEHILSNISATPGSEKIELSNKLAPGEFKKLSDKILNINSNKKFFDFKSRAEARKDLVEVVETIGKQLGAVDQITVAAETGKAHETSLPELVKDLNYLEKEFKKASNTSTLDKIASKIKNTNRMKTIASVGIVATLGFFSQFINNWITRKRTGKSGFVGYKEFGQDADKSKQSKENNKKKTPVFKGFEEIKKCIPAPSLESKKFMPTYEQLKWLIYPAGVIGKNLSVRSDDERREVAFKTSFAFLNFLVIPNLVDNLTAYSYKNKNLFNSYNKKIREKLFSSNGNASFLKKAGNFFKSLPLINQLKIKSYKDIEVYSQYVAQEELKKSGNVSAETLSKFVKNPSKELINDINKLSGDDKAKKLASTIQKELKGIKNVSKFAAIAYSFLTLGIGINIINIMITNKKHKKFLKHKKELENQKNHDINDVFKLELIKDPKFKNLYSEFLISNK